MPATSRPAQRRLRLPSPANARIRSKLALILVVPIAAILVLAALRLVDAGSRATDANRVGALTTVSAKVSALAQEVHRERIAAASLLAAPNIAPDAFNRQKVATDKAIAEYTAERQALGSVPNDVEQRLQRIDEQLGAITNIRKQISDRAGVSVDEVVLRYGVVIEDLTAYREVLGQVTDDPGLADALRAAGAFSRAKTSLGDEQVAALGLLRSGTLDNQAYSSFVATLTAQQEAFAAFALAATPEQKQLVNNSVTGDAVLLADSVTDTLLRANGQPTTIKVQDALNTFSAVDDLMRWSEEQIDADLIASAKSVSASVRQQALIESVVIILVLGLVIVLGLVMARSMIGSLRRLRQSAIVVAEFELPETVSKLRDAQSVGQDTPDQLADQVRDPIELNTRDEIGEVARAFNMVHREAVRVAAEQAVLRTSVSAMFLGLARRSQTLVDRMIGQLDRIERTEEDPKRLAELFGLDHLATRMRRNDENVLVLADADSTPARRDDAPLVDVMRAAQSEIEMYQRVEFGTLDEDVSIVAAAVNDVVRLIAELLDNATRFSPPTGVVVLEARRLGDRVLIQIEDGGLGMSPDTLNEYNARLSAPPALDVATFRMMGLAVVGRLAHRHGITVQIRDRSGSGTLVEVLLPAAALILPKVRGFRELPGQAPSQLGRGPAPFGALPVAPASPPGVPRPAPIGSMTRLQRGDHRVHAGRTAGHGTAADPAVPDPGSPATAVADGAEPPGVGPVAGPGAGEGAGRRTGGAGRCAVRQPVGRPALRAVHPGRPRHEHLGPAREHDRAADLPRDRAGLVQGEGSRGLGLAVDPGAAPRTRAGCRGGPSVARSTGVHPGAATAVHARPDTATPVGPAGGGPPAPARAAPDGAPASGARPGGRVGRVGRERATRRRGRRRAPVADPC